MDVEFDEVNNYIKFIIPDNQTNGESAKFEVEAEVYQWHAIEGEGEDVLYKSDDLSISGYL
jgi:hypothetical protein